jgi:hypothetical protein
MPKVYNEDQPRFVSIVPSFMLKTIIKDIGFAFHLFLCLLPHPHSAPRNTHQGQMKPQLFVSWTVVLHDV